MKRKVLIISHNPINQIDNMGKTIGNIFSKFKETELCQLFFREQDVEAKNCNEFFGITDGRILKSIFNRKYKTGEKVPNHYKVKEIINENVYQIGAKRTGIVYLLRNLLWKIGKWNTKELDLWIREQKPTSIFFAAGDYTFAFKIAIYISKKYNIPLYIYFTDEYYRSEISRKSLLSKIYKKYYRNVFKKTIKYSKEYFCISESMEKFYRKEFEKPGKVLMNTTNFKKSPIHKNSNILMSYIGNLEYGRWENILDIANVVERLNKKYNNKIIFQVYSGEKNKKIIDKLNNTSGVFYKKHINPTEVIKKINESDILLHTENFKKYNMMMVKYSISTKIPDCLASGKPLLVYGPSEVAAINYIQENNAGIVATNIDELYEKLEAYIEGKLDMQKVLNNAEQLVNKNHRDEIVFEILNKVLV